MCIMKDKLEKYTCKGYQLYSAEYVGYGFKSGGQKTILLRNISDLNGEIVADHMWIDEIEKFEKFNLRKYEKVKFRAIVRGYRKAYRGKGEKMEKDYELVHLKCVELLWPHVSDEMIHAYDVLY